MGCRGGSETTVVDIVNARLTRILVALALVLALVALHIALNRYTANASGLLALAAAGVFFTSWLSSMFWPRKFGSRLPAVRGALLERLLRGGVLDTICEWRGEGSLGILLASRPCRSQTRICWETHERAHRP